MEQKSDFRPPIDYQRSADMGEGRGGLEMGEILRRAEERAFFYTDSSFILIRENLKTFAGEKEAKKDVSKEREALTENWRALMDTQLAQAEDLLDGQLLRFKNPYPYDSRQQDMWFSGLKDGIRRMRTESWAKKDVEVREWIDRLNTDLAWGDANFRVLEGMGGVIDKFFDGKQMMSGWVRERFRSDPIATYYQTAFARDVPGLVRTEPPESGEIVVGSLREKAVEYQDQGTFWRMAVATVHQTDMTGLSADKKPIYDPEALPLLKNLSQKEVEFIREIFTANKNLLGGEAFVKDKNGRKYPKEILNWYSMASREDYKRRYIATMEALLTKDVKRRLSNAEDYQVTRDGSGNPVFSEELGKLIKEVNDYVDGRLKNWFSQDRTINQKLASVVVKSGIIFDLGHFSSSQMFWGWDYKEAKESDSEAGEGEKKLGVKRVRSEGATSVATDVPNMATWFNFHATTDVKAWPVSMLPPMDNAYRKEINRAPMGWVPRLVDPERGILLVKDSKLQTIWDSLWQKSPRFKWDPAVKEWLLKNAWYIKTPIKEGETELVFPVFFPPGFDSINFWNTISLLGEGGSPKSSVENGQIIPGKDSVWDELRKGKEFSALEWSKMGDQALYRWLITISQTVKSLIILTEQEGYANRDQFEDFFGNPARIKELLKRVDLGERDESGPTPLLTISLVPMLVVLRAAQKHGILGAAGEDGDRRSLWAEEIAKWIVMFRYMPPERVGVTSYGEQLAKLTEFYATVLARMGLVIGRSEKMEAENIYSQILSPEFGRTSQTLQNRVITMKPPVENVTRS